MEQTKKSKKYLIAVMFFALCAIAFGLIYYFNVIKNLSLLMTVPYILYFLGLAFFFNGSYCNETGRPKAKKWNYILGVLIVLAAAALLCYGFATNQIHMFKGLF